MAGTKIRGITVEIGGDTSGLNKALESTNKEIKSTQNQLKDVEKLLKIDPANIELLEQKQNLLNKRVAETGEKLELLKKSEAELTASGVDKNSEQFMALQREIISTEDYLKRAISEAEKFGATAEHISAQFDKVSNAAGKVQEKTKALSAVGGAVAGGLGAMALKAMTASDELNTLSQQSGFTTAELQKFDYASEVVDVSTDSIISTGKKLKKNMASTSADVTAAWEQLGISVVDSSGQMRDSTDVFYEVLEALSQIPNETERDQLAMTLFGKSADDLAGIIDDGGQKLKELGKAAEDNGLIWEQESIDAANAANDIIDTLKADVSQTILVTGAKALEALSPLIEDVSEKISGVLQWIGSLDAEQIQLIGTIALVVAAISPIAGIISGVAGAISSVIAIFPAIKAGFMAIEAFAAANPIVLIATAIAALTALVVKNWDTIKPILDAIWAKVVEIFTKIKTFIKNTINSIISFVESGINRIIGAINTWIEGINSIIIGAGDLLDKDWKGIPYANYVELPRLAKGGILSQGAAIVGEAGAELLTVSGGKAMVQPLTNNNTTNVYNQTSMQPIELSVQIDKQTLARVMYDPLQKVGKLKGMSAING